MLALVLDAVLGKNASQDTRVNLPDRFVYASPLPTLAPVIVDKLSTGVGIAQQTARSKNLQARMLWVDGTANLGQVNSRESIVALVERAKRIGFNTIVFDIKPIVGYTLYPSSFTEKLTKWREGTMPADFDPLPPFIDACKKQGISFMVSMNAFSEGHRMAKERENDPESPFGKPGPGYARPEEQTVQYVAVPYAVIGQERCEIQAQINPSDVEPDKIGLFTQSSVLSGERVIVDSRGVVQYDMRAGVPPGGKMLIGRGKAADFIYRFALPGRRLLIETDHKFLRASEVQNQIPLMMNPAHPNVRQRVLAFAREVVTKYAVDGLLFDDRLRFGGVDADFSPTTRAKFEAFVNKKINWPKDVFTFTYNFNLERGVRPGPYWDHWWTFRARELQMWVVAVRKMVKTLRPNLQFGIYAGSWYGEYTKWGANYARPGRRTPFSDVSSRYANTGFGDQLDIFIAGCYYKVPTIAEALSRNAAEGRTVEAGAALANRVIHDQAWTYAGVMLQDFYDAPEDLGPALQAACASAQGVMVFDYSHRLGSFEEILSKAFKFPVRAPHQIPKLLSQVRETQFNREKLGYREPPIFIQPGAPGVGH